MAVPEPDLDSANPVIPYRRSPDQNGLKMKRLRCFDELSQPNRNFHRPKIPAWQSFGCCRLVLALVALVAATPTLVAALVLASASTPFVTTLSSAMSLAAAFPWATTS